MAKFEDYNKSENAEEDKPTDSIDSLSADGTEESTPNAAEQTPSQEVVPEKYQNKSLADLVQMHQQAESVIGRQGNEVGELRGAIDKLIDANLHQPAQKPDGDPGGDSVESVDFFADPEAAMRAVVDKHPAVLKYKEDGENQDRKNRQATILELHPDVDKIFAEPEFMEWINKSKHRKAELLKADKTYDVDAGDALLSDYKEIKASKAASQPKKTAAKTGDVQTANTGNVTGGGGSSRTGKTIYRADIRKLKRDDPRRYKEMLPQIRKAYTEGRVQ